MLILRKYCGITEIYIFDTLETNTGILFNIKYNLILRSLISIKICKWRLDCMTEETTKLLKDIPIHFLGIKAQQMRIFILCMGITKTFIRYGFPITM